MQHQWCWHHQASHLPCIQLCGFSWCWSSLKFLLLFMASFFVLLLLFEALSYCSLWPLIGLGPLKSYANSGPLCGLVVIVHDSFFLVSWFCSWYSWSFCGFVVGLGFTFTNHDLFYGLPIFVHVFLHCVDHDFLSHLPIVTHDQGWVIVAFGQKMPPSATISARQRATIKRVRGAVTEQ
jgi:hypothetical protein